jgi:UTP--glucose-1-phosphate uridylyltransferase
VSPALDKAVAKAVIPAAGWGTRLLPATKVVPKVLTTVVDRPVIQWAVEESAAAGIAHVCLVVSPAMPSVAGHFAPVPELENLLESKGRHAELRALRAVDSLAHITEVVQQEARGLGHAILQAADFVGEDPFAVLLPDVVIDPQARLMGRLAEVHAATGGCVLALFRVPREEVSSYGVAAVDAQGPDAQGPDAQGKVVISGLVEKPTAEEAPSDLTVAGRYLLTPLVIEALRSTPPTAGGEIQLTDAIQAVVEAGHPVHGVIFDEALYDTGSVVGLIEANISLGLADARFAPAIRQMLGRRGVGE